MSLYAATEPSQSSSSGNMRIRHGAPAERSTTITRQREDGNIRASNAGRIVETNASDPKEYFPIVGHIEERNYIHPTLQPVGLVREIKAVISRVEDECVILNCQLPNAFAELSVPKSIVPQTLMQYATPVTLSVEIVDGYRQPVIRAREVATNPHYAAEMQEIDRWIETL